MIKRSKMKHEIYVLVQIRKDTSSVTLKVKQLLFSKKPNGSQWIDPSHSTLA